MWCEYFLIEVMHRLDPTGDFLTKFSKFRKGQFHKQLRFFREERQVF